MVSAEVTVLATVGSGIVLSTLTLAGSTVLQVRQHDAALFGAGDDDGLAGRVDEYGERIEQHDRALFREGIIGPVRADGGVDRRDEEGGRC